MVESMVESTGEPAAAPAPPGGRFRPGQVVTVFRSRLRPDDDGGSVDEYAATAAEMARLAATMPGLVDVKAFTADDGERLTVVTFEDEATQAAWRAHADHRVAQQAGRDRFYREFSLQVCRTLRARTFATGQAHGSG